MTKQRPTNLVSHLPACSMPPMPYRFACVAVFLLLTVSLGCTKKDERFFWQKNPEADFKSIRTYVVERNLEPFFDARERALGQGANVRQEIESEIHQQMTAKGFSRAEPGRQADVVVRFYGGPEETAYVEQSRAPIREMGRAPEPPMETRYLPMGGRPSSQRREGRLVIEIINPRTGKGLWRGTVEQAIPQQAGGDWATPLRQAVAGVMKEFPPPR